MQRRSNGGSGSNNNGRRPSNGGGRRPGGDNISVGNAVSARERYMEKAKEALSYGDRVSAENFFQHADHYNRIVIVAEERRQYEDAQFRDNPEHVPAEELVGVANDVADTVLLTEAAEGDLVKA
jgi:hypothetical protein